MKKRKKKFYKINLLLLLGISDITYSESSYYLLY